MTDFKNLIDELELVIATSKDLDLAFQKMASYYFLVAIVSQCENTVSRIFSGYAGRTSPELSNFVTQKLERPGSMKYRELAKLFAAFDDTWRRDIGNLMNNEEKDALTTVVEQRNKVAHGDNSDMGLLELRQKLLAINTVFKKLEAYIEHI